MKLDKGGGAQLCLLPGTEAGGVTVFARSGTVEASKAITVSGRLLPTGGSITINLSPSNSQSAIPAAGSTCGTVAPEACIPGQARRASVGFVVSAGASAPAVPDGTLLTVSVDTGWLSAPGGCAAAAGELKSQLVLPTEDATAVVDWCFGDLGGSGTLRAESGSVSATRLLSSPAIPHALLLSASRPAVSAGGQVTFTAVVLGCDGRGVTDTSVLFRVTEGTSELSPAEPVETSARGIASVNATAQPPVTVSAAVAEAQGVNCSARVEVAP